jgi:hypothetical protein
MKMTSTYPTWLSIVRASIWGIALFLYCTSAAAQISPGPLSQAHSQLEGVRQCATCHDFGAGSRGFKCLACHNEIQRRLTADAGYHSRAYKTSANQADCARCHMEHNGNKFALVRLDRKGFDHQAQTGFALTGKHRAQDCTSCHNAKKIPAAARAEIKVKNLDNSFLGLSRGCTSCHEDQHRGQLGADCARCHTQDAWKPVTGFNHSSALFQLTGSHLTVSCQKCHTPRAGATTVQFKGLAFRGCQDCHTDPHRGAFQQGALRASCDSCHNTSGWKNNRPATGFNHNSTPFPLSGKHSALPCSTCHKSSDFSRPIAHERCGDCHKDSHDGQFASRRAGSDCSACHTDSGFKPSRFDRDAHRLTAFPLQGKHATLDCVQCHQAAAGRGIVFMTGKFACSDCHQDPHGGEFAAPPHENKCDQCHTPESFRPSTFTVALHAQARFPLTGRHTSVACEDCHKPSKTPTANVLLKDQPAREFHFASMDCTACHTDPHQTRVSCQTCHATERWTDVRPFDHGTTGFKFEGAHQNVNCIQCHPPAQAARSVAGKVTPGFSNTPRECSGCHGITNIHGNQFMREAPREDCSTCHTTTRWNGGDFNHDRAAFTLDIAHRNVTCVKCHKEQSAADGKMFRLYRGTPRDCIQCH